MERVHSLVACQVTCVVDSIPQLPNATCRPRHGYSIAREIVRACEMGLSIGVYFGACEWRPDPRMEICLDTTVARGLVAIKNGNPRIMCVDAGYKAIHRALDLDPNDESLKTKMERYERWKTHALQQVFPPELQDVVLQDMGIYRWSTVHSISW